MESIVFSLFIMIVFFFIIFWGMKKNAIDGRDDLLERLNSMRGIFAIEIVIGHVIRYENTILFPLGKFMIISVAFFFFVSAFGMVKSFQEKEYYLKGFLLSKILYVLTLVFMAFAVNVCIDLICPQELGYCFKDGNLIFHLFTVTNWYLWELMLFYILFYVVYKYMKKYRILAILCITVLFISIMFRRGWMTGWYASAVAFPAGLVLGEYYSFVEHLLHSWKGKIVTVVLTIMGLSSLLYEEKSMVGMVYMKNIMCLAGICVLLYFCMYFTIGNRVNRFLGKYSTEIYLFQFVYLSITWNLQWNWKIRLIFVLVFTLLTAYIIHPVLKMIKSKIQRIGQEK